MVTIRHNRDTYAQHQTMIRWCLDNIGFSAMEKKWLCDERPFYHADAFGYLILTFYNEFDAFRFKMEWGGEKIESSEKSVDM
jgi:hypothetical protein